MKQVNKRWAVGVAALAQVCMGCGEEMDTGYVPGDILAVVPVYSVIVEQGEPVQLWAKMTDADGQTQTVNEAATWTSSDEDVATVSEGLVTGVSSGTSKISASFAGMTSTATVTVEPKLERIEIAPRAVTTAPHAPAAMRAVGIFADGSKREVTDEATWISVDPSIASVTGSGRFTGKRPGEVQVNALLGEIGAAPRVLTVEDATLDSLRIDAPSPVLPVGEDMRLGVTGRFDANGVELTQDLGALATWKLVDTDEDDPVAKRSDSGVLIGLRPGTAEVTATWTQGKDGIEKSASLDIEIRKYELVAIEIQHRGEEAPAMLRLPLAGEPARLAVLGTYEADDGETLTWDITEDVTWRSEGTGARVIRSAVRPFRPGTVTLEAVATVQTTEDAPEEKLTDEIVIEVVDAPLQSLEITPRDQQEPAPGATRLPLAATGTFAGDGVELTQDLTAAAIWEVDDAEYVTIANIGPDVGVAQIIAQPAPGEEAATVTVHARYRGSDDTYTLSVPPSAGE